MGGGEGECAIKGKMGPKPQTGKRAENVRAPLFASFRGPDGPDGRNKINDDNQYQ